MFPSARRRAFHGRYESTISATIWATTSPTGQATISESPAATPATRPAVAEEMPVLDRPGLLPPSQVSTTPAENVMMRRPSWRSHGHIRLMSFSFLQRLLHGLMPRPVRLGTAMRTEVRPPLARPKTVRWVQWLRLRLAGDHAERPASAAGHGWTPSRDKETALTEARNGFLDALGDITSGPARLCLDHVRSAHSLHELWHLRSAVFSLVSRHHSQGEAERRLSLVDRHFSSRSGRRSSSGRTGPSSWAKSTSSTPRATAT